MQIKKAQSIGYCSGVKRALQIALDAQKKYGTAYTYGDLIHNKQTIARLNEKGIISVKDPGALSPGDTIIISAHGASDQFIDKLKSTGLNVIDACCPCVKKIHNTVKEYCAKGYAIVIFGHKGHPEVRGIAGCCDRVYIIWDCEEFPQVKERDILCVVQTTFDKDNYLYLKEKFSEYAKDTLKKVVFFDSICYTTVERQAEAKLIAQECDTTLVVGDKGSSNANRLLEICAKQGSEVYLIENVDDLSSLKNKNIAKLGIISGASVPEELILEVLNKMVELNANTPQTEAEVNAEAKEEQLNTTTESIEDLVGEQQQAIQAEEQPAVAKPVKAKKEEELTMAEAMKKYSPKIVRQGAKLKVKVVSADASGISVAILGGVAGKNDSGFIDKDEVELEGEYNPDNYKPDDILEVMIIAKDQDSKPKTINLSKKELDALKIDDEKVKDILAGAEFTLACNKEIKGGLLGKIGSYTVFVPASQIKMGFVKNLADYVGKPLRLKMLPPKEEPESEDGEKRRSNPKRIVASQRIILEQEKQEKEDEFWNNLNVDTVVQGKVKRFSSFGAFVSVKGFDCLAHISDLSWTKINSPSEVLELNKTYDFLVLRIDRANNKVSIGYKQLQKQPYDIAREKYPVGSIVKGKVERIKPYGAFVEIEPGVDGLVHVSQIGHKWIKDANEALKEGDEIEAKIIGFEDNKITLSIKELLPEEEPVAEAVQEEAIEEAETGKKGKGGKEKPRKKEAEENIPREYVSQSNGATFADVFKDLNLADFEDK
jgi:(E)-4-hydroxy-3-methyl-but-2-enyl pyrophosphate reductase